MKKYKFLNDYITDKVNFAGGGQIGTTLVKRTFKAGEIIEGEVRTIKIPVQCALAPCPDMKIDQIYIDGYHIPGTEVQRYGNEVVESITGKQISSKTIKNTLIIIAVITILYLIFKSNK